MPTTGDSYQLQWPAPLTFLGELLRAAYINCPHDPVTANVERLHHRVHQAIRGDAVVQSIEHRYPALGLLHGSPTIRSTAVATLEDLDAFRKKAATDSLLKDVEDVFSQRANRIAERILRDFAESDECSEVFAAIVAHSMTFERVEKLAEQGASQLAALLTADGVSIFSVRVMSGLDTAFTPSRFEKTRQAIRLVTDAILPGPSGPMERQLLRALLEDVRDATDLEQGKERMRWIVETLLKPTNSQTLESVISCVLDALRHKDHGKALTRGVARYPEMLFRAVLEYWRGTYVDPDDPSLLSVKEAAAYLGIRPYSLHTHIRRRAGTAAEVPVAPTKTASGRKAYVLELEKLKQWEKDHWRAVQRGSRGPA